MLINTAIAKLEIIDKLLVDELNEEDETSVKKIESWNKSVRKIVANLSKKIQQWFLKFFATIP